MSINDIRKYSYSEITGSPLPYSFAGCVNLVSASSGRSPAVSIVMPIFNKERTLVDVLSSLMVSIETEAEIIIVDDASTDASARVAFDFLHKYGLKHKLFVNETPLYETACDNIGFFSATSDWLIEVQSDLYIRDSGFESRMINLMHENDLGSLSGRAGHNWSLVYDDVPDCASESRARALGNYGLLGNLIYDPKSLANLQKGSLYITNTNNRGPWLVSSKLFRELKGLDSNNFFLGNDDHDFNFRCFTHNKYVGYTPVEIRSIPSEGSTRQARVGLNHSVYELLKSSKKGDSMLRKALLELNASL